MPETNNPLPHSPPAQYRSIYRAGLFDGQVIVITGAGSGMGRCTAHELASLGAQVVLVGRTLDKLQTVAQEIEQAQGLAACYAADIRDEERVKAVVGEIVARFGRIDGLVNNAGGQFPSPLHRISAKGFDAVVRSNLTGGFLMARECYNQAMRVQKSGAVVNIIMDIWGAVPGMGHSGAARAGMVSFTETAALEWAHSGVRVNAVAPGYIASSGMDHYPLEHGPRLRAMAATVPLGRFGNEAETSAGIVFLLGPAASFISGSVLRIDGARPQVRLGSLLEPADASSGVRDAVKPFDGFHRASTPRVFQVET